jgi:hypothetical protein
MDKPGSRRAFAVAALSAVTVLLLPQGCTSDAGCGKDTDCDTGRVCTNGNCVPAATEKSCGETIVNCGCYGLVAGDVVGATGCASGSASVRACAGTCAGSTENVCTCDQTSPDAGHPSATFDGAAQHNPSFDCSGQPWAGGTETMCSNGICSTFGPGSVDSCTGSVQQCGGHDFYCPHTWTGLCCGGSQFIPCPQPGLFPCFATGTCVVSPTMCPAPNTIECTAVTQPDGC